MQRGLELCRVEYNIVVLHSYEQFLCQPHDMLSRVHVILDVTVHIVKYFTTELFDAREDQADAKMPPHATRPSSSDLDT